ncbi:hypothetical protein B0H10DRAFT_2218066 [Mycena sp. CBHHK59/15]|nr:hypothetical protein B0H10DRAFT_2218066 [Mycena sp. CBHHK59/15]
MRPLPSPPTSASSLHITKSNDSPSFMWPQDEPMYSTPSTTQTFTLRFPIGPRDPATKTGGPRQLKARRRVGRIFTHSASSSVSSFDSTSTYGITSEEFWMPPQEIISIPMQAAYLTVAPPNDETKIMPDTTPRPKTKSKPKPANIVIPPISPIATAVSPKSPAVTPALSSTLSFPTSSPDSVAVPATPRTPLTPLLSPLSPNPRVQSPNARVRKLAKLTRTLGENIPVELVFPSGSVSQPIKPAPLKKVAKPSKVFGDNALAPRISPAPPRPTAPAAWPLTPTPDCTFDPATHTKTAVGLHYALGVDAYPAQAATVGRVPPALPSSPPPFSNVFTMDDVSWEHARQAVMGPRGQKKRRAAGVHKASAEANGRGTWRKKESTWSGEWNVEDMDELQVQLRRLRLR